MLVLYTNVEEKLKIEGLIKLGDIWTDQNKNQEITKTNWLKHKL